MIGYSFARDEFIQIEQNTERGDPGRLFFDRYSGSRMVTDKGLGLGGMLPIPLARFRQQGLQFAELAFIRRASDAQPEGEGQSLRFIEISWDKHSLRECLSALGERGVVERGQSLQGRVRVPPFDAG